MHCGIIALLYASGSAAALTLSSPAIPRIITKTITDTTVYSISSNSPSGSSSLSDQQYISSLLRRPSRTPLHSEPGTGTDAQQHGHESPLHKILPVQAYTTESPQLFQLESDLASGPALLEQYTSSQGQDDAQTILNTRSIFSVHTPSSLSPTKSSPATSNPQRRWLNSTLPLSPSPSPTNLNSPTSAPHPLAGFQWPAPLKPFVKPKKRDLHDIFPSAQTEGYYELIAVINGYDAKLPVLENDARSFCERVGKDKVIPAPGKGDDEESDDEKGEKNEGKEKESGSPQQTSSGGDAEVSQSVSIQTVSTTPIPSDKVPSPSSVSASATPTDKNTPSTSAATEQTSKKDAPSSESSAASTPDKTATTAAAASSSSVEGPAGHGTAWDTEAESPPKTKKKKKPDATPSSTVTEAETPSSTDSSKARRQQIEPTTLPSSPDTNSDKRHDPLQPRSVKSAFKNAFGKVKDWFKKTFTNKKRKRSPSPTSSSSASPKSSLVFGIDPTPLPHSTHFSSTPLRSSSPPHIPTSTASSSSSTSDSPSTTAPPPTTLSTALSASTTLPTSHPLETENTSSANSEAAFRRSGLALWVWILCGGVFLWEPGVFVFCGGAFGVGRGDHRRRRRGRRGVEGVLDEGFRGVGGWLAR